VKHARKARRERQAKAKPKPPAPKLRRRDAVQVLHERRVIDGPEVRAALEIRRVWSLITGALWARSQRYERYARGTAELTVSPVDDAYVDRYKPWADTLTDRQRRTRVPWLDIVHDAIVDERTLSEIDAGRRWREGRAADLLREALELYATMAGWEVA